MQYYTGIKNCVSCPAMSLRAVTSPVDQTHPLPMPQAPPPASPTHLALIHIDLQEHDLALVRVGEVDKLGGNHLWTWRGRTQTPSGNSL
eukprot:1157721-Pelagomonas_calceolata.AAC.5